MRGWPLYALLMLPLFGWLLLKFGSWLFDRKAGKAKSIGAAGILIGFSFLVLALILIWVLRIQHLFRRP